MSTNFTSTQNTGNLKDFIEKIPSRGIPKKVTINYLVGLGYKSKNDRTIVTVLKSIGLVESNGVPSDKYSKLRSSQGKKILANMVKDTYSGLFEIYSNAQSVDDEKLKDYFASVTSVGDASLRNIIKTFKALCQIADFSKNESVNPVQPSSPQTSNTQKPINYSVLPQNQLGGGSSQVHLNIQVHIPGEQSAETYEVIFKNLGKYVLGINGDNG